MCLTGNIDLTQEGPGPVMNAGNPYNVPAKQNT